MRGKKAARFGAVAAIALGFIVSFAAPAQAHNYLVSSTPEAGSTLTALPEQFAITTNDNLLELAGGAGGFALQVQGGDGLYYGNGCVKVAGPTMTATPALGPAGDYTLAWQVVSTDGHTVSDEFTFTWAPADDAEISKGSQTAPVCPGSTGASAVPRPSGSGSDSGNQGAAAEDNSASDVLWIGGAVLAIAAAVVGTLLVTGRKKKS